MKISTSILSIKKDIEKNIDKLGKTKTDYIHLDIMDGIFVENKTDFIEYKDQIMATNKILDVHLMVEDVDMYIEKYKIFNPDYITFHLEVKTDIYSLINKIKKICKVGISIKPNTTVQELKPYLKDVDLVLVMSVEPGKGGQKFMEESIQKIEELVHLRKENNYIYEIQVDGGINKETIEKVKMCDIAVVGSYITNEEDYEKQIENLKY